MTKPKFAPMTDPAEVVAVRNDPSLIAPIPWMREDGSVWADADELRAWRQARSARQSFAGPK